MRKFLKRIAPTLIILFLIGLIAFNFRLYYTPTYHSDGINQDLLNHLNHLKGELHNGAATDMQRLFPEGHLFLNALYGLTWIEVAKSLSPQNALYQEAHGEIDWVIDEMASEEAKRPFNMFIKPAYGIFYRGWCNYVLGRKLMLLPDSKRDSNEVNQFRRNCASIIGAMKRKESPFLESYGNACWPADMVVGMASVAIHEEMFPGTYVTVLESWLKKIESKTDSLGLIPHSCHCIDGEVREPARGSSQSLILNFLRDIDPEYAKSKFTIYKKLFLETRMGLPGIREYPKGQSGSGDIDSGPVIWGIGGAASIVGQRTMALYGESKTAIGLRNSIEGFGVGKSISGKKNYLFGQLAIADAFIAWSNSVEAHESGRLVTEAKWRTKTHLLSLVLFILGGLAIFFLRKKRVIKYPNPKNVND